MRESLRWLGYMLLAAIVCVVLLFAFYRLRGPSQAQRAALAWMHKDYEPKQGRNAFPLLWLMSYDVPESEMDSKVAEEVADVERRLPGMRDPIMYDPPEAKLSEATADDSLLCKSAARGCLAKVEGDREAVRSALAEFPVTLAREKSFEASDFYWNVFPADYRVLVAPTFQHAQGVWISALALRWADGDRVGAIAGVCRNIGAWRRMRRDNNSLAAEMLAILYGDGGMRLFGDMLAKTPTDVDIPAACEVALRPIEAADVDRCADVAHEQVASESAAAYLPRRDPSWWDRAADWVMYDYTQTQAWRAELASNNCGEAAVARMLRDETLREVDLPRITHRPECVAGVLGCVLADIPGHFYYIVYDRRILDFVAHLRLAGTLLWLRENSGDQTASVRFEHRPATLRSGVRGTGIDTTADILFVDNLDPSHGARFELPIPMTIR